MPSVDVLGPSGFGRPLSPMLLAVGIWPAVVHFLWRARLRGASGDLILWLSLIGVITKG